MTLIKVNHDLKTDWLNRISPILRPGHHTGYRMAPTRWIEASRIIYDHELVIFGGEFIVELDGQKHHCPPNSFLIIPPGKEHKTINISNKPAYRYWVHFDWLCDKSFHKTPLAAYFPAKSHHMLYHIAPEFVPDTIMKGTVPAFTKTLELHKRLCERHNYGNSHEKKTCRAILFELLIELLDQGIPKEEHYDKTHKLTAKVRQMLADTIEDIITKSASEIPSVQKLLAETGYSYAYLSRLFKKSYGISPISYINLLRIERAKLLIEDTNLKISQIAKQLGFESNEYFTRLFHKKVGLSPSEYRERT